MQAYLTLGHTYSKTQPDNLILFYLKLTVQM